ncbi:MAG: ABC transporter ATP-binding protein [Clostridia bacterium]|nr:ABC transporter ATP-binding protein [Clostridia bacterium]
MKKEKQFFAEKNAAAISDILSENGVEHGEIVFCSESDMDRDFCFSDFYVAFDKKDIFIISGAENLLDEKVVRRKKKPSFDAKEIEVFKDVEKLSVVRNVTTCVLLAKNSDGEKQIAFFSFALLSKMCAFVENVNFYIENKQLPKKHEVFQRKCISCGKDIPFGSYCRECSKKKLGFGRVFEFFKSSKKAFVAILVLMGIEAILSLVIPQVSTKKLYDEVLNPGNSLGYEALSRALFVTVGTIALIKVVNLLIKVVYQFATESILPHVIYRIKNTVFASMQRMSLSFYTSKQTGSLMERVSRDANNIYFFMVDGMPGAITSMIKIVGVGIILLFMNWQLTVLMFVGAPIILATIVFFEKKIRMIHHRLWLRQASIASAVNNKVNGHRIIKTFAKEDEELEDFKKKSQDLNDAQYMSRKLESVVLPMYSVALYLFVSVMFFLGGVMVLKGKMTVGTLMAFVVYVEMLREPAEFLTWLFNWWERCVDSSQRVFEIIDSRPDVLESDNPTILGKMAGKIEIRNLNFEYEVGHPVIKDLNLTVEPGTMLGITGKTGAGKSTLVNLIARLYDPRTGDVLIDSVNVRDLPFEQLRKNVGMVSQEIYLFSGSIADNIKYAKPEATFEEVVKAAKAANAHEFIMRLPDGYDTRIGSGGQDLSGGERQRISIARTIIQNPKVLILDEATAAMDTATERKIQSSVAKLKEGRTTIAIAHRLSTLKDADKIAVITDGELTEYGTFEELIKLKGEYYNLYKIQNDLRKQMVLGEDE